MADDKGRGWIDVAACQRFMQKDLMVSWVLYRRHGVSVFSDSVGGREGVILMRYCDGWITEII